MIQPSAAHASQQPAVYLALQPHTIKTGSYQIIGLWRSYVRREPSELLDEVVSLLAGSYRRASVYTHSSVLLVVLDRIDISQYYCYFSGLKLTPYDGASH
jgi:hypothetical protein